MTVVPFYRPDCFSVVELKSLRFKAQEVDLAVGIIGGQGFKGPKQLSLWSTTEWGDKTTPGIDQLIH